MSVTAAPMVKRMALTRRRELRVCRDILRANAPQFNNIEPPERQKTPGPRCNVARVRSDCTGDTAREKCWQRMQCTKTFHRLFGYTNQVLTGKPTLRFGDDLRDLPTYTVPEAALFLGISPRTVGYWFCEANNILKPSGWIGEVALLSFRDLAEAYVLAVLTKFYDFRLRTLRGIVANAKLESKLERPLVQADLTVLFSNLIIEKPARGSQPRHMVDIAHGRNLVFPEFVDQLGKRILRDRHNGPLRIYPWRLVTAKDESRPVSVDPQIMSGRLVVTGTRIPVKVLLGKRLAGKSAEQIAHAYRISVDSVQKALLHIDRPLHKKAA